MGEMLAILLTFWNWRGAEEILIPEEDRGLKTFKLLKKSEKTGKASSIVVVAEGDKTGKNVFELASYVEKTYLIEVRVSVLGHMQGRSSNLF